MGEQKADVMRSALVTGASRGVGKGVAIALARAGYRVYATGRTIENTALPDGVIRIPCDHTNPKDNLSLFQRIPQLDVLVNSAWGGYERMVEAGKFTWGAPFWEQPDHRWTGMLDAGVRAAFTCSAAAARIMVPNRRGLIVNISFWAAQKYVGNTIYGIAKAATDKMSADMAHELRAHGVAAVSLYPGLVRTESVLEAAKAGWLDLSNSESPEYIGMVIAELARDPKLMDRSGQALIAAALGAEYGLIDVDGRQPKPLSLANL
ncbi:MAG: SDR family NAD(P)-dependent oxidoreductase [Acidobacteriia bacterium]|nr:SDR family NAD(P)-dependent oxidoreductase [Terriglobia bacterium]